MLAPLRLTDGGQETARPTYQRPPSLTHCQKWGFTNVFQWFISISESDFMHTMFASFLSGPELVVVFVVILVLFGSKKIPEFAKGLGQGIKEFKKASREVTNEI